METENLTKLLESWFKENQFNKNRWNDNEIGLLLKQNLLDLGNWKNKARGNPQKAKAASDRAKRLRMGF